jgi:hypothetical protein
MVVTPTTMTTEAPKKKIKKRKRAGGPKTPKSWQRYRRPKKRVPVPKPGGAVVSSAMRVPSAASGSTRAKRTAEITQLTRSADGLDGGGVDDDNSGVGGHVERVDATPIVATSIESRGATECDHEIPLLLAGMPRHRRHDAFCREEKRETWRTSDDAPSSDRVTASYTLSSSTSSVQIASPTVTTSSSSFSSLSSLSLSVSGSHHVRRTQHEYRTSSALPRSVPIQTAHATPRSVHIASPVRHDTGADTMATSEPAETSSQDDAPTLTPTLTAAPIDIVLDDLHDARPRPRPVEQSPLTRLLRCVFGTAVQVDMPLTFPSADSLASSPAPSFSSSFIPEPLADSACPRAPSAKPLALDNNNNNNNTRGPPRPPPVVLPPFSALSFNLPSAPPSPSDLSLPPSPSSPSTPPLTSSPVPLVSRSRSRDHAYGDSHSDVLRDLVDELVTRAPSPSRGAAVATKILSDADYEAGARHDANGPTPPSACVPNDADSQGSSQDPSFDVPACLGCLDVSRDADFVCRLCGMGRCANCGGNWDQHTQCLSCAPPRRR